MVAAGIVERFVARAEAAGSEIRRFGYLDKALASIAASVRTEKLGPILVASDALPLFPGGSELPLFKAHKNEDLLQAKAGLVRADWGISATGTLVHLDRTEEEKLVWTLPSTCFCVLEEGNVFPSLSDLGEMIGSHLLSASFPSPQVSLITGPSRTADIECELTLGVHGPGRLIILLVKSAAHS